MANSEIQDCPNRPGRTVEIKRLGVAQVDDYQRIRLSALTTSPDAFGSIYSSAASLSLAQHAERIASTIILGAYDGEDIVGMVGLRRESGLKDAHKGFLWGFYVEPSHRGRGVGGSLVGTLLENVRGLVEQVTLSVVADSVGAIALYERYGIERYGLEPRAMKTADRYFDELLMVHIFAKSNRHILR